MHIHWQYEGAQLSSQMQDLLAQAADACVALEGLTGKYALSVILVDDARIKAINQAQRAVNKATDVLSFPTVSFGKGTAKDYPARLRRELDPETGCLYLGDIVISMDHAQAQATEFEHSLAREIGYLLIHGLCHLMGYDHMQEEDKRAMRRLEEQTMARVRLTRSSIPFQEEI